jgi:hypothetical protein
MFIILSLLFLWFLSGAASFIFWWTKDADLSCGILPFVLILGLFGPAIFFVGAYFHYHSSCTWRWPQWSRRPGILFDGKFYNSKL